MSKAEQRANEAYPPTFSSGKLHAKRIQAENVDTHAPIRTVYLKGYKQAEQDLALTWEDMRLMIAAEGSIYDEHNGVSEKVFETYPTEEAFYSEVLRRFKEQKNDRQD